jgi:hypothetical protein
MTKNPEGCMDRLARVENFKILLALYISDVYGWDPPSGKKKPSLRGSHAQPPNPRMPVLSEIRKKSPQSVPGAFGLNIHMSTHHLP